jgi:hypothetical protein
MKSSTGVKASVSCAPATAERTTSTEQTSSEAAMRRNLLEDDIVGTSPIEHGLEHAGW